jgi:hypothetical protein
VSARKYTRALAHVAELVERLLELPIAFIDFAQALDVRLRGGQEAFFALEQNGLAVVLAETFGAGSVHELAVPCVFALHAVRVFGCGAQAVRLDACAARLELAERARDFLAAELLAADGAGGGHF